MYLGIRCGVWNLQFSIILVWDKAQILYLC